MPDRFAIPGLMPTDTPKYSADTLIKLEGNADLHKTFQITDSQGAPANITGNTYSLIITDARDKEVIVAGAAVIIDAVNGLVQVSFSDGARAVVGIDDGMHRWVLSEVISGQTVPIQRGSIFRTTVSGETEIPVIDEES